MTLSGKLESILEELKSKFGEKVKEVRVDKKLVKVSVELDALRDVATFLRDKGFEHVKGVTGTDLIALRPSENAIELLYHIGSYLDEGLKSVTVTLATKVPRDNPEAPSLVEIWPSVEYHERETYEMLGVKFLGHPDLRKLLLPEWWADIPPLRKDYKPPGGG